MTLVLGDMTSGEMTFGRLDRKAGSALRLHSEEGQQTASCTETTQEVQSSVG